MLGDEGATPRCPHPALPRSGRTESPARWALPSSQHAPGARARPALRCLRPLRSLRPLRPLRPHPPCRGPPLLARPVARGPASGPFPLSHWPACGPRRCLSRLPRRPLAIPDPPRKFEKKKKKSFMGGWKGPGQRRGREGPGGAAAGGREGRRRRRDSRSAEPSPRVLSTFLPPALAAPGCRHDGECTPRQGCSPSAPPGREESDSRSQSRAAPLWATPSGRTGRLSCLTCPRPHFSEPGARSTPTPRRWEL